MNKLTTDHRTVLISALVEGNSIRATAWMTDTAFNTVLKFVVDIGTVCRDYLDKHMRNLSCRRLQADEIWQFCYAKDKNVPDEMKGMPGVGSVWTWIAIDADTKLVPIFHVGTRDAGCAYEFMNNVASRMRNRVQLTTDGHGAYLSAVDYAFGFHQIDYAMLIKLYGTPPPECIGAESRVVSGHPDAIALHYVRYNFVRIHKTLRCTPAMEAGVSDRLWTVRNTAELLETNETKRAA